MLCVFTLRHMGFLGETHSCRNSPHLSLEAGGPPPPPFAPVGLHVGLWQGLLVTRSVLGRVWTLLPESVTPVAALAAKFRALGTRPSLAGTCQWACAGA